MPYADIALGLVNLGVNAINLPQDRAKRDAAQRQYDASLADYMNQDTSNLYANLQNTAEDLTVNTQQADFIAATQAQGLSNTLNATRQAAGASGIAALAQSMAAVQSRNAIQASASIGQQEAANQRFTAQQAAVNQRLTAQGAEQARTLRTNLLSEQAQIDAGELAIREKALQDRQLAMYGGLGTMVGGVGDYFTLKAAGDGDLGKGIQTFFS